MVFRSLAFIACLALAAVSGVSLTIATAFALLFDACAWPAAACFRADQTPRSIFETRRAGLA